MAGASRRCRPAVRPADASRSSYLDTPVDYDNLMRLGSIMGSGGMIVMDETSCMVDVAQVLHGVLHERILRQVRALPRRHGADVPPAHQDHGVARPRRPTWRSWSGCAPWSKHTSLCGLGQSAPNPVLSTLRYFRDEYLAHISAQSLRGRSVQADVAAEVAR